MPSIGNPNQSLVWPSWSTPSKRYAISRWPKNGTARIDGRLRTTFYQDMEPIPSRVLARFGWSEIITLDPNFQWFWADVQILGVNDFLYDFGTSPAGVSLQFELKWIDSLPQWVGGPPGFRFVSLMTAPPDTQKSRTIEVPGWPVENQTVDKGLFGQNPFNTNQMPEYGDPFPGATFPYQGAWWQPMSETWPLDELTTE